MSWKIRKARARKNAIAKRKRKERRGHSCMPWNEKYGMGMEAWIAFKEERRERRGY